MGSNHAWVEGLEARRLLAFGKTDTSFGTAGRADVNIPNASGNQDAEQLIVATGGKIVAGADPGLVRLNADGSPDNTFGKKGTVRIAGLSFASEAADGSGNIYVLGFGVSGTLVLKFTSAGVLDNSFGTRGTTLVVSGSDFDPRSIAVQGDGKIVVAGTLTDSDTSTGQTEVFRINTDGSPDNTFGTSGSATLQLGSAPLLTPDLHDDALGVTVLGSGKILIAGGSYSSSNSFTDPSGNEIDGTFGEAIFAVARLNTDGSLDGTYGAGGISRSVFADADTVTSIINDNGGAVNPTAVAFQSDGSVFLGAFDTSTVVTEFAASGSIAYTARPADGTPINTPVALVGLTGGRVAVLAETSYQSELGYVMTTINSAGQFANLVRTDDLNPDTPEFDQDQSGSLAIASSGKLLVGGESSTSEDFLVGQYTQGTASDPRPDDFASATVNSMVTDNTGALHLAYYDPGTTTLKYAYRAPNGLWNPTVTVDSTAGSGSYLSIALQNVNKGTAANPNIVQEPSIAYFSAKRADFKLAESTDLGQHWTLSTIANKGSVGLYPTLMYDSKGRPTVAFYDRTNGDADFGQRKNGVWKFEIIDSAGDVGRDLSLEVNSQGDYVVAYFDVTNNDVKYAVQGSHGVWTSQIASKTKGGAKYISLADGGDFGPGISFFDVANADSDLSFMDANGKWKTKIVASTGAPGLYSHIQFNGDVPTIFAWNATQNAVIRYGDASATPDVSTLFTNGGQYLNVNFDGTVENFAFLDTTSGNLHVRFGPGPE